MHTPSLIRAAALLDLPAVLLEAGIEPYSALRAARIDPLIISSPDMMISADRVAWLLDTLAEQHGLADLAIRIAFRRRLANLGVAGLVLIQQSTPRQALETAEKYKHLLSDALSIHVEDAQDVTTLTVNLMIGPSTPGRQSRELGLAACVHVFRLLLGETWAPEMVHFSHPAPKGATLHRRFFGCPVMFGGAFDGLECRSGDLDRVNTDADANLASYSAGLLDMLPARDPRATSGMVVRLIQALLPMGRASIENVAKAMNRNIRTLQRDLEAEGSAFKALLIDVRLKLAMNYLSVPSAPIDDVAARLGYASPTAFIRFFRTQTGVSPGLWRKRSHSNSVVAIGRLSGPSTPRTP